MDDPAGALLGLPLTEFPAGLVARPRFDNFEAMAAAARGWNQQYVKLSPGPFRGSIDLAHTGRLQLGMASWSSGILSTGSVPRRARTFGLVAGTPEPARHAGVPVRHDQIATLSDRDELHFLHPKGCELLVFSVARDLLDEMTATFVGDGWDGQFAGATVLRLRDEAGAEAELRCLHEAALAAGSDRLCEHAFATALEQAVAEALLGRLDLPPRQVYASERRRLAARTEDYLRANRSRPVTIAELCAATGAPERTLHDACRERFGMPPIAFLRILRLHGARRQLLEPGRATSVTAAATSWGFFHFGEFAAAYRCLFDEVPSQTLRRTHPAARARAVPIKSGRRERSAAPPQD